MTEIRWTIESEAWLRDIHDYIAQDNPSAAAKVVEGIYEKAQLLKEHSEIGTSTAPNQKAKSVYCFMGTTELRIC